MKALCFLGTGKYEVTTYVWKEGSDERSYETHLFPEAVAHIFRPEKIFVLVTPQAREHENFKSCFPLRRRRVRYLSLTMRLDKKSICEGFLFAKLLVQYAKALRYQVFV